MIFNRTNETALKAFECLKPFFGNMFHFENDSAVQNLCRIALNRFEDAREVDLFTGGLAFFDEKCAKLEPLMLFSTRHSFGIPLDYQYLNQVRVLNFISGCMMVYLGDQIAKKIVRRSIRFGSCVGLTYVLTKFALFPGEIKYNDFLLDQKFQTLALGAITTSAFRSLLLLKDCGRDEEE